jgi:hypothetical protein
VSTTHCAAAVGPEVGVLPSCFDLETPLFRTGFFPSFRGTSAAVDLHHSRRMTVSILCIVWVCLMMAALHLLCCSHIGSLRRVTLCHFWVSPHNVFECARTVLRCCLLSLIVTATTLPYRPITSFCRPRLLLWTFLRRGQRFLTGAAPTTAASTHRCTHRCTCPVV